MKPKTPLLTTPVLFLVFNRLDTTKKVFAEIKKAKPKQLFIASDGARENKPDEKEIVKEVREWVLKNIDWGCEVKTLFRRENLGCKYSVSGAIEWFFNNIEQGIILEDDCLPSQSFFRFCEELLEKYKDEEKVMMISGTNFIEKQTKNLGESYFFSKNAHIWGWATWKRVWEKYDAEINNKMSKPEIKQISSGFLDYFLNLRRINNLKRDKINTWDYQLDFIIKINKGLNIIPKKNLIENIGFLQNQFTNAKPNAVDIKYLFRKKQDIFFPLKHPTKIRSNKKFDRKFLINDLKRALLKKVT